MAGVANPWEQFPVKKTGAHIVAAACENCRLQLGDLNNHYELGVQITALADLIVKAMRLPQKRTLASRIPMAIAAE